MDAVERYLLLGLRLGLALVCAACAFVSVKAGALPDA